MSGLPVEGCRRSARAVRGAGAKAKWGWIRGELAGPAQAARRPGDLGAAEGGMEPSQRRLRAALPGKYP
jgi:hypothetical protein